MPSRARESAKKKPEPERRECEGCGQDIRVNKNGELRYHTFEGEVCAGGAQPKDSGIEQKAHRYLTEGRVKVTLTGGGIVEASVQGSAAESYRVLYAQKVWSCSCEAQVWRCTHVVAVMLVAEPGEVPETEVDRLLDHPSSEEDSDMMPEFPDDGPVPLGDDELEKLLGESIEMTTPTPEKAAAPEPIDLDAEVASRESEAVPQEPIDFDALLGP